MQSAFFIIPELSMPDKDNISKGEGINFIDITSVPSPLAPV